MENPVRNDNRRKFTEPKIYIIHNNSQSKYIADKLSKNKQQFYYLRISV
jgi:hypothetical protein